MQIKLGVLDYRSSHQNGIFWSKHLVEHVVSNTQDADDSLPLAHSQMLPDILHAKQAVAFTSVAARIPSVNYRPESSALKRGSRAS